MNPIIALGLFEVLKNLDWGGVVPDRDYSPTSRLSTKHGPPRGRKMNLPQVPPMPKAPPVPGSPAHAAKHEERLNHVQPSHHDHGGDATSHATPVHETPRTAAHVPDASAHVEQHQAPAPAPRRKRRRKVTVLPVQKITARPQATAPAAPSGPRYESHSGDDIQAVLRAIGWTVKGGNVGPQTIADWQKSANARGLDPTIESAGRSARVNAATYATLAKGKSVSLHGLYIP